MWIKKLFAPLAAVAIFATAPVAEAATVASVDAAGSFEFATTGSGVYVTVSSFTAQFDPTTDLNATNDYIFAASLDVGGSNVFDDSLTVPDVTLNELLFGALVFLNSIDPNVLNALGEVVDTIAANDGTVVDIGFGLEFSFFGGPFALTPSSISGPFQFAIGEAGFGAPSQSPTSFAVSASISTVAPVPLPATAPLLLFAVGGIAALRRRRKTA